MSKYRQTFSNLAYLYLVVALVVPALVPAGYMISKNSTSNLVEVTVCSAINHQSVLVDVDTGRLLTESESLQLSDALSDDPAQTHSSDSQLCPFALASAAFMASEPVLGATSRSRLSEVDSLLPLAIQIDHPLPPLPARGPPILS